MLGLALLSNGIENDPESVNVLMAIDMRGTQTKLTHLVELRRKFRHHLVRWNTSREKALGQDVSIEETSFAIDKRVYRSGR